MISELYDLEISEVSLTTEGANGEADVLIFKRSEPVKKMDHEMGAMPVEDDPELAAGKAKLAAIYRDRLTAAMAGATTPKEVEDSICATLCALTNKSAAAAAKEQKMDETAVVPAETIETLTARAVNAEAELAAVRAELATAVSGTAKSKTPADIEKAALASLPAEIRKRLEGAESEIRKMRDEKELAGYVAKAATLTHLPIVAADFGAVLKAASASLSADQIAELDRVLKAADEALRGSFTELGKNAAPAGDDKARFLAKVQEHRDKGADAASALALAAKADPELYDAYRASVSLRA